MFETRNYRVSFLVSLFFSTMVHIVLFWSVRVDINRKDEDFRRSVAEMRKFFFHPSVRSAKRIPLDKVIIRWIEEFEGTELTSPQPVEESWEGIRTEIVTGDTTLGEAELVHPFHPDSLDLLFLYPWMFLSEDKEPRARRLIGLERALRRIRFQEVEEREQDGLTTDTKQGKFGVTSMGLLLGPIVIPIPLAPYVSGESRKEEQAHEEIRDQSLQESMRDQDLKEQKDRIIEWKERNNAVD